MVAEDRKVAVRFNPIFVSAPNDGFGGWTYDEFLFEAGSGVNHNAGAVGVVHKAVVGDDGTLFGKAFHMLSLTAEERFRYEEGEIGILMAGGLEHIVEGTLHLLPDCIAIGFDDHAATHG